MKKYEAPKMDVKIFAIETVITGSPATPAGPNDYVLGFGAISDSNKVQAKLDAMQTLTKFTF